MIKKTITYEDFDGQTRTEDFYFNLFFSFANILAPFHCAPNGFEKTYPI